MNNLCLPDLFYSAYVNNDLGFLGHFKQNTKQNSEIINYFFDEQFRKELSQVLDLTVNDINHNEIELILKDFSLECFCNYEDTEYFISKHISNETANDFQIGLFDSKSFNYALFIDDIKFKYSKKSVVYFINYLKFVIENSMKEGEFSLLTIPSFDTKGNCKGLVFRNLNYVKQDNGLRNLFKFFITHPSTYFFNEADLDSYEELYLVEGVFDKLFLHSIGIPNVISASANRLSQDHFIKLKDKKVIAIYDNDLGGFNGLQSLYKHDTNKVIKGYYMTPLPGTDLDEMTKENVYNFLNNLDRYDTRNLK